ncbi:hypothetical protein [Mucilaginibacter agri]|uniref:Uncharacterized protein n=1 Tax=Mucilaginibacter agri TaxID=2695265 RepID=A0A966DW34_9SPHI|nr:hypothetical protein [Mucilaginibacter agri]NCD72116.1 hypothetical protein [Mucilaginibacter agri]
MRRIGCFSVATFTSIIMFISARISFRFKNEFIGNVDGADASLVILQGFLLIKYIACTVVLMPGKVNLNQLALGFLTADLLAAIAGIFYGAFLVLPIPIITVQIIVIGGYRLFEHRQMISINIDELSQMKKGLLTEGM